LLLNHHTIEPLSDIFGMNSAPFRTLTGEFRRRVVEEAAAANIPLMLTLVWNLAGVEDVRWVGGLISPYVEAGLRVSFVELAADLETRLLRNRGEDRLVAKPSKRDVEWSEAHLRERERWTMNTNPAVAVPADELLSAHRHVRLDNRRSNPQKTAEEIVAWHSSI